jgi:hypothetical protein
VQALPSARSRRRGRAPGGGRASSPTTAEVAGAPAAPATPAGTSATPDTAYPASPTPAPSPPALTCGVSRAMATSARPRRPAPPARGRRSHEQRERDDDPGAASRGGCALRPASAPTERWRTVVYDGSARQSSSSCATLVPLRPPRSPHGAHARRLGCLRGRPERGLAASADSRTPCVSARGHATQTLGRRRVANISVAPIGSSRLRSRCCAIMRHRTLALATVATPSSPRAASALTTATTPPSRATQVHRGACPSAAGLAQSSVTLGRSS